MRIIDMTGKRFGRLTVVGRSKRSKRTYWNCVCDCGSKREVVGHDLRRGATHSCGCQRGDTGRDKWTRHGKTGTPEHRCWAHMRQRCTDQDSPDFKNYGGRGIGIDVRWDDFSCFLEDMGPRPSPTHTIERIDNEADYSPDNCVWATRSEQNQNKRNVKRLKVGGETLTIRQAAERAGLSYMCVYKRLRRGVSIDKIMGAT